MNIVREPSSFQEISNYYPTTSDSTDIDTGFYHKQDTVIYSVTDGNGNTATQSFTFKIIDSGIESFVLNVPEVHPSIYKRNIVTDGDVRQVEFTNPVTFIDANDPQLESTITQESGNIKYGNDYIFTEVGKYNINYLVTDGAGNTQNADVIVKVYDTQQLVEELSSVLSLSGVETKTFNVSELTTETLNNVFPTDLSINHAVDGSLTVVREPATFDTVEDYHPTEGQFITHSVSYNVSDSNGNTATQEFNLIVTNPEAIETLIQSKTVPTVTSTITNGIDMFELTALHVNDLKSGMVIDTQEDERSFRKQAAKFVLQNLIISANQSIRFNASDIYLDSFTNRDKVKCIPVAGSPSKNPVDIGSLESDECAYVPLESAGDSVVFTFGTDELTITIDGDGNYTVSDTNSSSTYQSGDSFTSGSMKVTLGGAAVTPNDSPEYLEELLNESL